MNIEGGAAIDRRTHELGRSRGVVWRDFGREGHGVMRAGDEESVCRGGLGKGGGPIRRRGVRLSHSVPPGDRAPGVSGGGGTMALRWAPRTPRTRCDATPRRPGANQVQAGGGPLTHRSALEGSAWGPGGSGGWVIRRAGGVHCWGGLGGGEPRVPLQPPDCRVQRGFNDTLRWVKHPRYLRDRVIMKAGGSTSRSLCACCRFRPGP